MKIAKLPDGTRLAFDDNDSQEKIDAAVRRYLELTRQDKGSVIVNVPEIKLPDYPENKPEVKVEVINQSSPELEKAMLTIGAAMGEMKELRSSIEALSSAFEKNTKSVQTELRTATTAVVTQMATASKSIVLSATELRATLEKSKEFEFDLSGNPTKIHVMK